MTTHRRPIDRSVVASAVLAATIVFAFACGGSSKETPEPKKPTDGLAKPDADKDAETPLDPGPTAEEALTFILATVESGTLTEAAVTKWFAPDFLKQVPAAQLVELIAALKAQLPPLKVLSKEAKSESELAAVLETQAGGVRVIITVNKAVPRQINGLVFKPAATEVPPKSFAEARGLLEKSGSEVMLSVSEIKKGVCTPVQNLHATKSLAIGSTFKLWVLAALDRKIAKQKKLSWDTQLAIDDKFKSLPSGVLQDQPAGTQLPLREYATKMISISDNTATDHLIHFVGRTEVEKMFRIAGHSSAKSNIPVLTTREFFALKLASNEAEIEAYRKASVAKKRKLLDGLKEKEVKLEMAKTWLAPKLLDIEYFATGPDLCNVMATIGKQAGWNTDADVLQILGKNQGIPVDESVWSYVGFKGGSEPGVINLSFLLKRKDDRWFVVTMTVNDATKVVSDAEVVNVAGGVLTLVGNAE